MYSLARSEPILDTAAEPQRRHRSREQLARIAATLNLSAEAFLNEPLSSASSGKQAPTDPREALELFGLFEAITDPGKRRACLAFVRAAAEKSEILEA